MRSIEKISLVWTLLSLGALGIGCGDALDSGGTGGTGGTASAVCGDGIVVEECDDGNTDSGDGCDAECAVEEGYSCGGEPSTCFKCGDGVVDASEQCDGGSDLESSDWDNCGKPDAAPAKRCQYIPTTFRLAELSLASPFIDSDGPGAPAGSCQYGLNSLLAAGFEQSTTQDAGFFVSGLGVEPDCLIDLGFVIGLTPLSQTDGAVVDGFFAQADCTDNKTHPEECNPDDDPVLEATPCTLQDGTEKTALQFTVTKQEGATCFDDFDGVLFSDWNDLGQDTYPIGTKPFLPSGLAAGNWPTRANGGAAGNGALTGCAVSDEVPLVSVALGSLGALPLQDARVAFRFSGEEPAERLLDGVIAGFLSREDATALILPDILGSVSAGTPLSDLLPTDLTPPLWAECSEEEDIHNDVRGWWVYFAINAEQVPWDGGEYCGDGIVQPDLGETCDKRIAQGQEGACPVCGDDTGNKCTEFTLPDGNPCAPLDCIEVVIPFNSDPDCQD